MPSTLPTTTWSLLLLAGFGCSNLHEVEPGAYYRCAQLSESGFRSVIDDYGIQTVLRLRGGAPGNPEFDALAGPVADAGIQLEHVPMSGRSMPPAEVLIAIWEVFDRAERPILVHCKAGADRTGLASAIYVLHETGDLREAREQLHVSYLHLGWGSMDAMDRVLDLYEPYAGVLDFGSWLRTIYDPTATTD